MYKIKKEKVMAKQVEKTNESIKGYYTLGCCGIDCGLCLRFYTEGDSKCPGCGGPNFSEVHPSCSILNCCFKKNNLEVCSLCNNFPCEKYVDKKEVEKDTFVTHKRIFQNFDFIKNNGINEFIKKQKIRIELLNLLLEKYNDNKSKAYYCFATAILSVENIENILQYIKNDKDINIKTLKEKINGYAKEENIELKLKK
jgi:hypothetical protein